MNPYAANFQVPVPNPAATATATGLAAEGAPAAAAAGGDDDVGLMDEEGEGQEAVWVDDPDQHGDGTGGYWDEHGQHHPGYAGEYDPTAAVYHPDGYGARYHQVCVCVCVGASCGHTHDDVWCAETRTIAWFYTAVHQHDDSAILYVYMLYLNTQSIRCTKRYLYISLLYVFCKAAVFTHDASGQRFSCVCDMTCTPACWHKTQLHVTVHTQQLHRLAAHCILYIHAV